MRSRGRGRGLAILCILDGALLEEQRVGVGEIAGAGRDERSEASGCSPRKHLI